MTTRLRPSGRRTALRTRFFGPVSGSPHGTGSAGSAMSHNCTEKSSAPVTRVVPSGPNARAEVNLVSSGTGSPNGLGVAGSRTSHRGTLPPDVGAVARIVPDGESAHTYAPRSGRGNAIPPARFQSPP